MVNAIAPKGVSPIVPLSAFVQVPGWQDTVLQLLVQGSPLLTPPIGKTKGTAALPQRFHSVQGGAWEWRGPELGAVRTLLMGLHVHCVRHVQHGWQHVQYTLCTLRELQEQGCLDGWSLAHEVCALLIVGVLVVRCSMMEASFWTNTPPCLNCFQ